MIATLNSSYTLTYLLDHARTLMTQNDRMICLLPVVAESDIGMADAGGNEAYQNFILSRTFHVEGFDLQGPAFLTQNGCPNLVHSPAGMLIHRSIPPSQQVGNKWFLENARL